MNNIKIKHPIVLTAIGCILMLLCTACSGCESAVSDDAWASDGSYASWDAWASGGDYASWDVWVTDGDYASWDAWATDGSYRDSTKYFATDGNAQTDRQVRVSTVDELLNALDSYTRVVLAPGVYDLDTASDGRYTKAYWKPCYDKTWELVLTELEHCAIVGETGDCADVQIVCSSRAASVLRFENCYNCQLTGVTLGHTEGGGCLAGVLDFEFSSGFYLGGCELYGCGSVGICAANSSYITADNTLIRDCSSEGCYFYECTGIHLANCELRSCGYDAIDACQVNTLRMENTLVHDFGGSGAVETADALFSMTECYDVVFTGCELRDNICGVFITGYSTEPMSMDECSVHDNRFASFTPIGYNRTVLADGREYDGGDLTHSTGAGIIAKAVPALKAESAEPCGEQDTVSVSSVPELLDAIGSNREIVLRGGTYDFTDYMLQGEGESWSWQQTYGENGEDWFGELVIRDVTNMTLRAEGRVEIVALPRYAAVLHFENCRGLTLSGFTAGHKDGASGCNGAVVYLYRCNDVTVEACDLYGCGTFGVEADRTHSLTVRDTTIHDCSQDFAHIWEGCSEVRFENCDFNNNPTADWISFGGVEFVNCRQDGAAYDVTP